MQFQIGAVLQHSNTPSLRVAGFEDDDDDEDENEAPHEHLNPLRGCNSGKALLIGLTRLFCKQQGSSTSTSTSTSTNAERRTPNAKRLVRRWVSRRAVLGLERFSATWFWARGLVSRSISST